MVLPRPHDDAISGRTTRRFAQGTFTEEPGEAGALHSRARAARAHPSPNGTLIWTNGDVTLAGSLPLAVRLRTVPAVVFLHAQDRRALGLALSRDAARQPRHRRADLRQARGRAVDRQLAAGDAERLGPRCATAVARLPPGAGHRSTPHRAARAQPGRHTRATRCRAGSDIAFIIASAAAGLPMDSVEIFSILNSQLPDASSAADSANARTYVAELVAVAYQGQPRARLDSLAAAWHDRPWFFAPPAPTIRIGRSRNSTRSISRSDWWAKVRRSRSPHLRRGGPARPGARERCAYSRPRSRGALRM